MKYILSFSFVAFLFLTNDQTLTIQTEDFSTLEIEATYPITFECNSCTKRNKFFISGPEVHTFKEVKFPLNLKLKSGEYEMTYWQNRVQQIHLPFNVSADSENVIMVKH